MKKDCALFLVFAGFLILGMSLFFLVTSTQPLSLQTISLLTKCTNEMSPPTVGGQDWCARTFFTLFEFPFPALFFTFSPLIFFSPIYFTTLEITFLSLLICNPEGLWKFRNMSCRQVTTIMPYLESFQCLNNTSAKCSTWGKIHFKIYKQCRFLLKAILVVTYYFLNNTLF